MMWQPFADAVRLHRRTVLIFSDNSMLARGLPLF